jgi:hypothetical protein
MTGLRTYKFLAKGAVGPISGFAWPIPEAHAPGAWLETEGALEPCVRGTHVCRTEDLAYWIHDELWETEAEGESVPGFDCLVTRKARLVRRFDSWHNGGSVQFVVACADHAAEALAVAPEAVAAAVRGFIEDARVCVEHALPACGAFSAALAVAKLAEAISGEAAASAAKSAYRRERSWQASWIARHVIGN